MQSEGRHDAHLADLVQRIAKRQNVPGMAVGVLHDGSEQHTAFGIANVETGIPVGSDTRFRIASVSKPFTATLAMRLVEEGLLQLDAPIVTYLPDLRLASERAQRTITLRYLLSHQSGLQGAFTEDHGMGENALPQAIARFHTLRQVTAPGAVWSYCNAGYHLIGAAIARVLDMTYEDAMQSRLFDPLGMHDTTFSAEDVPPPALAIGHVAAKGSGEGLAAAPHYYPRNRNPAGGMFSTTGDLLRFAAMHLSSGMADGARFLSPKTVQLMQAPQVRAGSDAQAYGLGWALRTIAGVAVIGHAGDTNGFRTRLTLVPARRFALAVLANSAQSAAAIQSIETSALAEYCGLQGPAFTTSRTTLRWLRWQSRLAMSSVAWKLSTSR